MKDPQTGVWHEWQIGTKSLTKMIEEVRVILPEGSSSTATTSMS